MRSVSVVIPTYNRADLLPQTLDAVSAQSVQPSEIIVVDDGSTDGTPELLARCAPRVRCIRITNAGDLAARNAGLAQASGELVAFCDSDDLWQPDFLQGMVRAWELEPRLNVAYGNFRIVRDGIWQDQTKFDQAPRAFWEDMQTVGDGVGIFFRPVVGKLLKFQPFFTSAMVADRQFLLNVGGWDASVGRTIGGDFATALRVAEHPPLGVLWSPLVGIRKHRENRSGDTEKMNLGDADVLDLVLAARPSLEPYADQIRASAALRRSQALESAFARQDLDTVRRITALLPPSALKGAVQLKANIASLPRPAGKIICRTLLGLSSIRGRNSARGGVRIIGSGFRSREAE